MLLADGFALGAAVATGQRTVQVVVFFAVILHKVRERLIEMNRCLGDEHDAIDRLSRLLFRRPPLLAWFPF